MGANAGCHGGELLSRVAGITLLAVSGRSSESRAPIRVGTTPWLGQDPLHSAEELGCIDIQEIALIAGWYRALNDLAVQLQSASEIIAKPLQLSPAEVLQGLDPLKSPDRYQTRSLMQPEGGSRAPLVTAGWRLADTMQQQVLHHGPDVTSRITPLYSQ